MARGQGQDEGGLPPLCLSVLPCVSSGGRAGRHPSRHGCLLTPHAKDKQGDSGIHHYRHVTGRDGTVDETNEPKRSSIRNRRHIRNRKARSRITKPIHTSELVKAVPPSTPDVRSYSSSGSISLASTSGSNPNRRLLSCLRSLPSCTIQVSTREQAGQVSMRVIPSRPM